MSKSSKSKKSKKSSRRKPNSNKNQFISFSAPAPDKGQSTAVSLSSLTPIFIHEMNANSTHRGKKLIGKIITNPTVMTSIMVRIEDDFGNDVLLAVYNLNKSKYKKFTIGTILTISEPYYKLAMDGNMMVRVDNPKNELFFNQSDMLSNGKNKSSCEWKLFGNKLYMDKNFNAAIDSYSNGIESELLNSNLNILISNILSNRAACYFKLKNYNNTLLNAGAAVMLNPKHGKSWYRLIDSLVELGYHNQADQLYIKATQELQCSDNNNGDNNKLLQKLEQKLNNSDSTDVKTGDSECNYQSETIWCCLGLNNINLSNCSDILTCLSTEQREVDKEALTKIMKSTKRLHAKLNDLKGIGNKLYSQGFTNDAICIYSCALTLCENLCNLFNNRAATLMALEQYDQSIQDSTVAFVLNVSNIKALYRCAESLFMLGYVDSAQNICQNWNNSKSDGSQNIGKQFKILETKMRELKTRKNRQSQAIKQKIKQAKENKKKQNNEEKVDAVFQEPGNFVSTGQLGLMNQLFQSFAPQDSYLSQYTLKLPKFHELYATRRGWPKYSDSKLCQQLLAHAYETACAIKFHEMNLSREEFILTGPDLLKRLSGYSPERIQWYTSSQPGAIDTSVDLDPEMIKHRPYDDNMFHSFSNSPDQLIKLFSGTTHIGVGFCDLRLLAVSTIHQHVNGPVRFVGVEMSAYSVAKAYVIYEMLKHSDIIKEESILEVWYSSTWTNGTSDDFIKGVEMVLATIVKNKENEEVIEYLTYWKQTQGKSVSVKQGRRGWLNARAKSKSMSEVACFEKVDNILDMCHYVLTGEILARNENAVAGNVTMFDNSPLCTKKAQNESVYHILEYNRRFTSMFETNRGNISKCIKNLLLQDITNLKSMVLNNRITIELIHGKVVPTNKKLIKKLSSMHPYSVSWSNCIDYIPKPQFHKMAKQIGNLDCVHFAYSMNWVMEVFGSMIIDYAGPQLVDVRKQLLDLAKQSIEMMWKLNGMIDIFRFPPITNAINFGTYPLVTQYGRVWYQHFVSKKMVGGYAKPCQDAFRPLTYSPLNRANTVIDFAWTYDKDIRFQPQIPLYS